MHTRELAGGVKGQRCDHTVEDGAHVAVHDAVVQAVEVLHTREERVQGDGWGAAAAAAAADLLRRL